MEAPVELLVPDVELEGLGLVDSPRLDEVSDTELEEVEEDR